jgi:hypothetical protein
MDFDELLPGYVRRRIHLAIRGALAGAAACSVPALIAAGAGIAQEPLPVITPAQRFEVTVHAPHAVRDEQDLHRPDPAQSASTVITPPAAGLRITTHPNFLRAPSGAWMG